MRSMLEQFEDNHGPRKPRLIIFQPRCIKASLVQITVPSVAKLKWIFPNPSKPSNPAFHSTIDLINMSRPSLSLKHLIPSPAQLPTPTRSP